MDEGFCFLVVLEVSGARLAREREGWRKMKRRKAACASPRARRQPTLCQDRPGVSQSLRRGGRASAGARVSRFLSARCGERDGLACLWRANAGRGAQFFLAAVERAAKKRPSKQTASRLHPTTHTTCWPAPRPSCCGPTAGRPPRPPPPPRRRRPRAAPRRRPRRPHPGAPASRPACRTSSSSARCVVVGVCARARVCGWRARSQWLPSVPLSLPLVLQSRAALTLCARPKQNAGRHLRARPHALPAGHVQHGDAPGQGRRLAHRV
jgi:hypothetical protein